MYYNIPSNNRELQLEDVNVIPVSNYNIPSNNRELQHTVTGDCGGRDYNIPSNNRELQLEPIFRMLTSIITYQVITGNYSRRSWRICT